jgi:signal transduction histidine kinase
MSKPPAPFNMLDKIIEAIPFTRDRRRVQRENARLHSFLRSVPLEYCGWNRAGTQAISQGFCRLLGIDAAATVQQIAQALVPDDGAALTGLFDRLVQYGEHFDIAVHTQSGRKSLQVKGRRGVEDAGTGMTDAFSVIWLLDITGFADAERSCYESLSRMEEKEASLRATLNALPFPVWTRDTSLDLAWCNKAYARILDDTAAGVVAEQKELPVTGSARAEIAPRVLAQRAGAKSQAQSARGHVISGGARRLMEMTEIPLPSEKTMAGVAIDVTAEEDLAAQMEQLSAAQREVLEQLRTAIAMFDPDTRLSFYNSAYEQLTGMSGAWLDTRPRITEIVDKMRELRKLPEQADYKQFKQNWVARFTSLEPREDTQYLPDGSVLRMVTVPRPAGGLMLTLEDVTTHLRLETSYNTLMAVQQETMDNLGAGIAVFGEDGRMKLSNTSYARMWNLKPEDTAKSPHVTVLAEKTAVYFDTPFTLEARDAVLAGGLEREPRKGRLQRSDGMIVEYAVMPLPDGNILNTWSDITDTVKVEQALLEKNAALEEAERLKSDFLANVSYQLRTPLNAIMGFAEMLNQQYVGKLNERQMEYTGSMIEAGQRLISLINDILDLSAIEAGYMELNRGVVALMPLAQQVTKLTEEWALRQKLETVIDCPDPGITVNADERRVKQVMLNLISNAINYSPGGGTITISIRQRDAMVAVTVRDTGLGIPPEDITRVFTPFDRIHNRKTQKRGGAGLGLALVKSIIELHGGTVSIESRERQGTSVTVTLPAA